MPLRESLSDKIWRRRDNIAYFTISQLFDQHSPTGTEFINRNATLSKIIKL